MGGGSSAGTAGGRAGVTQAGEHVHQIDTYAKHVDEFAIRRHVVYSRRMDQAQWHPELPFNSLPLLPPAATLETTAVLKDCIGARSALAALSQAVRLIPNQNILISTLPLLEAQASSEIENIVTTADKLFKAAPGDANADPATREALRYRQALIAGFMEITERPIGTGTAVAIARRIRNTDVNVRNQEQIHIVNHITGATVYTPPRGERLLRDLLENWETFLHSADSLDPLVKLAVSHYQFEAIHPFTDGNGRTGRVLNSLYLIEAGLLTAPVLYLSRYIIRTKSDYYQLLQSVTAEQAWEDWLRYMIRGIEDTANWTLAKIEAMRRLMEVTRTHFREQSQQMFRQELVDLIFEWPYIRISNVVESGLFERQTASRYLKRLAEIGILQEIPSGREKLFVNTRLMQLLTAESNDFAPFS